MHKESFDQDRGFQPLLSSIVLLPNEPWVQLQNEYNRVQKLVRTDTHTAKEFKRARWIDSGFAQRRCTTVGVSFFRQLSLFIAILRARLVFRRWQITHAEPSTSTRIQFFFGFPVPIKKFQNLHTLHTRARHQLFK
jgi:hypothetical protein